MTDFNKQRQRNAYDSCPDIIVTLILGTRILKWLKNVLQTNTKQLHYKNIPKTAFNKKGFSNLNNNTGLSF